MSVDRSSTPSSVELSTLEKVLTSQDEPRNHRTPLSRNNQSTSLQELVNIEQLKPVGVKLKRYCRIITMCMVIAVVWGMMAETLILYYLGKGKVSTEADMCTAENYTGSICREVLQAQQSYLPDRNATSNILIATDPTVSQYSKEEEANQLIRAVLSQSPTSNCAEELVPFLCFYIFPLCDSSGRLHQPSSADCNAITNGTCANAISVENIFRVDECQTLPELSTILKCNVTDDLSTVLEDIVKTVNTTSFNGSTSAMERACSDGFYIDESSGLCVPECGVWKEFPSSKTTAIDIVWVTSAIVNLVSGTAVMVLSCIKHKRFLAFPTVFIVYSVIGLGVSWLLMLIGYFDRTSLYCSSRNLLASVVTATQFCNWQGIVFFYGVLVQTFAWFFHIVILFWGVKFPLHAKTFERRGYTKYIHIAMAVLTFTLPCGHVAAVGATGGATIARFPPLWCFARNVDAYLYSFIFPLCIMMGTGTSLLLMILWSLITTLLTQRKQAKMSKTKKVNSMDTAKFKVQIVLLYFLIITSFSVPTFSVSTLTGITFAEKLFTYFDCESQGIQPGRTCERMFDRSTSEILNTVNGLLYGLYPVVNFLFFINFHKIYKKLQICWTGNNKHQATRTTTTNISQSRLSIYSRASTYDM